MQHRYTVRSNGSGRWRFRAARVLLLWAALIPAGALCASDGYYRTLMPPLLPPSPAPANRPGILNQWHDLHAGRRGKVQKMVILSDEPRQAAMTVLQNPCLGVTMAGYALSAGMEAERARQVTCVDLYFEGVTFSWHFLQSPGATARPEYSRAWQLYHQSLERLVGSAQRFGRLDPTRGLTVVTPMGMQTIPTSYHGFVWRQSDFTRVEMIDRTVPKKLKNHYSCPGLGVPLIVVRQSGQQERFLNEEIPFNATAVLRPSLAALAGQAPPIGAPTSHGPLEFYDPLRVSTVKFNDQCIAMATNTSAALEYSIRQDNYSPWVGLLRPGSAEAGQEKLFMIEPYQPGKYPVVFVHGFLSSPRIWAQFANEIMARRDLRDRVQLMAYRYPTGRPFLESAAILRRELLAMKQTYDPRGEDPGIANTAIVGHSMGGLVSKLTVTYSDDRLWYSVANRPLTEINVSDDGRKRLHDLFYFEPIPFVRRVVFMGTPHAGAQIASQSLGRWSSSHVQLPSEERLDHSLLIKQNPGAFKPEITRRIPTSIDLMEPSSCLLRTIKVLCAGPNVQLHNIVGVGCFSPLTGCGDGVVARRSAQHHSVSTERQIHTTHGGLHETDEAIEELLCILQRHILEANDVPSVDGYEFAVPEYELPGYVMPEHEWICPEDPCLEQWCPEIVCPDELCPEEDCPEEDCPEDCYPEIWCPDLSGLELNPATAEPQGTLQTLPPRGGADAADGLRSVLTNPARPAAPAANPGESQEKPAAEEPLGPESGTSATLRGKLVAPALEFEGPEL